MYDFIDYAGEKRPNWSDDQFYWMAVCEHIAAHWYFILTMDELGKLYIFSGKVGRVTIYNHGVSLRPFFVVPDEFYHKKVADAMEKTCW